MTLTARASASLTITLGALATSASLTVGRCSTAYDNSTNLDEFLTLMGAIFTGTTPTAGVIEVWAFRERADGTWPALFTGAYSGTDAGFTVQSRAILLQGAVNIATLITDTTSNQEYAFYPYDLPVGQRKFAVFVTHSTVAALKAASHDISVKPNYYA